MKENNTFSYEWLFKYHGEGANLECMVINLMYKQKSN
jgi:hypothetical protein